MVDSLGVKWYLDQSATAYATGRDAEGTELSTIRIYLVEELNGAYSFVVVRNQDVIFESPVLDKIGEYIDKMKSMKRLGFKVE